MMYSDQGVPCSTRTHSDHGGFIRSAAGVQLEPSRERVMAEGMGWIGRCGEP